MSEINKPDYTYLWSSGGANVAPSNGKVQTGWTAEVPPFQWENWSQNRQDQAISHILQKGISVWSATGEYYFTTSGERSYVQGSDGNIYVAVADSVGQNPVTDATDTYWQLAFTSTNPVVSSTLNLKMSVPTASASGTVTADEIIVGSALGGLTYKISSYSKVINLATVGAGGMDTGTAPVSGYVALYAIYNPLTATSSVMAVNSPNTVMTPTYTGANMPAGYTASALLTVVPTNGSSQFRAFYVGGREVSIALTAVIDSTTILTNSAVSISAVVPANAISVAGQLTINQSVAALSQIIVKGDSTSLGQQSLQQQSTGGLTLFGNFHSPVITAQTVNVTTTTSAGTPTFGMQISSYTI